MIVTLLQPLVGRANKAYSLGPEGQIIKTREYRMQKEYAFLEREAYSLEDLYDILKWAGPQNFYRVNGVVKAEYKKNSRAIIRRKNDYFDELPTNILNIDIDDWPCQKFSYLDRDSIAGAIKKVLSDNDLEILARHKFISLFSQSAWATDKLRVHLYFWLDSAVEWPVIRNWGKSVSAKLDSSVWKLTQPDFISQREVVEPLKEIIPNYSRLFIINPEKDSLPNNIFNSVSPIEKKEKKLTAKGWRGTIAKTGNETENKGNINFWGYHAAAQLVEEHGPQVVRENLEEYATLLHDKAWEALKANSPERGGQSDIDTYGIGRYRQYLRSAIDKKYGAEKEADKIELLEIIEEAKQLQDGGLLFERDVLAKLDQVSRNPLAWQKITSAIKSKLRGVVSITDLRKAISASRGTSGTNTPKLEVIREVLYGFDWIYDEDGARYLGRAIADKNGLPVNYEVKGLGDGLDNIFYHIGAQIDPTIPPNFGKTALSYLLGSLHGNAPGHEKDKWVEKIIGQQAIKHSDILWWRLNDHTALKISKDSIEEVNTGLVGLANPIIWYNSSNIRNRIVDTSFDKENINLLWKYILCLPDDRPNILAWLLSSLSCSDTQMLIELIGPSGAAKSSAGSVLRDLVEPKTESPFLFNPKERMTLSGQSKQDKYRILKRNTVIFIDNISSMDAEEQNFFCQLLTGITADIRILYTSQMEEVAIKRPVIVTSLEGVVTAPDLLSRSIKAHFVSNPERTPGALSDAQLFESWAVDKPKILGALARLCQANLHQSPKGRRGAYIAAMKAVFGEQQGALEAEEAYKMAQRDLVLQNNFCMCFYKFISAQMYNGCLIDNPSVIYQGYKKWIEAQWGKDILIDVGGTTINLQIITSNNNSPLPQSARGLGALLNKYAREFENVFGLSVVGSLKEGGVRKRVIKWIANKVLL